MTVSLYVFLLLFIVYLLIFLFFTFFNLYHVFRFGFRSFGGSLLTFIYIIVTLVVLFICFYYIAQIDWNAEIRLYGEVSGLLNSSFE